MQLNKELNYEEACKELNDTSVKSGRNRDLQLARWNKIAEVEKVGRGKYVIKRQLSQEEIQENEYNRNYSKFLQNMLINMFAKNPSVKQTYTYRELREYLSMVNMHYFPVKYGDESIDINAPYKVTLGDMFYEEDEEDVKFKLRTQEKYWFQQADSHDKDALHYALRVLRNRGLLVEFRFTYIFYKAIKNEKGIIVYNKPVIANDEQYAEVHQRVMEFLKSKLSKEKIDEIDKRAEADREEDKENKIFGIYKKVVLSKDEVTREEYGDIPKIYAKEIGYDGYAKAITIIRPTRLENLIDTFAPKFNKVQVEEFLKSKRFKKENKLPESVHIQLTNQLIKK